MQLLDLPAEPLSQLHLGEDVAVRIFHAAANANARRLQNDALCQHLEVRHISNSRFKFLFEIEFTCQGQCTLCLVLVRPFLAIAGGHGMIFQLARHVSR